MRHSLVFVVSICVAAAHWWVIFGPGVGNYWQPLISQSDTRAHGEAVWVSLPEPAPATQRLSTPEPEAAHTAAPARMRKTRKSAMQQPAAVAPAKAIEAIEAIEASADSAVHIAVPEEIASPPMEAAELLLAQTASQVAHPFASHPHLQVRDSLGTAVHVALPADGSALSQSMLLRFKVHGFVKGMEYHANAELQWNTEGNSYHARQSISAFLLGSMEQTSAGRLTAQGLQPQEFTDRRFAKHRSVQFDWDAQKATFEPPRTAAPIGSGAQDRLSVFLQLAAMLQAMPSLRTPGTRIDIPTLGARRLQMWTFVVEHAETLALPNGPMHTLRLQRLPQAGDEETALLWVNPAQGYVPVRIRMQERNGDVMDLTLKSSESENN